MKQEQVISKNNKAEENRRHEYIAHPKRVTSLVYVGFVCGNEVLSPSKRDWMFMIYSKWVSPTILFYFIFCSSILFKRMLSIKDNFSLHNMGSC